MLVAAAATQLGLAMPLGSRVLHAEAAMRTSRSATHALPPANRHGARSASPTMGFMDSLAAAFENDETLGDAGPAGLKKKVGTQRVTWKGPEPEGLAAFTSKQQIVEQEAMPGTPLKDLADAAGVEIKFSCMKGTCGICEVEVDGVMTTACTAKLARGRDIVVEYKDVKEMQQYAKEIAMRDSRLRKQMKTGMAGW